MKKISFFSVGIVVFLFVAAGMCSAEVSNVVPDGQPGSVPSVTDAPDVTDAHAAGDALDEPASAPGNPQMAMEMVPAVRQPEPWGHTIRQDQVPRRGSLKNVEYRTKRRESEMKEHSEEFGWWPSDAKPAPVKDEERGGYWWYPTEPGQIKPWGNRGYIYVYKIIFDYKADELPLPEQHELRPSLLVRKIIKNVKVYFDFDKSDLREDAKLILDDGLRALKKNPKASVLVTGNADSRGSEQYNFELAKNRGVAVVRYLAGHGLAPDRIRLVSRGKLDATAPVTDLVGMQKDRNAQFVVAVIEEVMLPYEGPPLGVESHQVTDRVYLSEEKTVMESTVQVSTREYEVQEGDTLSGIAEKELGSSHRWRFLHEFNKDRIDNPDKLLPGQIILIPEE